MRLLGRAVAIGLLSLVSVSAVAALSPKHQEWGKGPVQWIMTREDKRAWDAVKTDQEAIDYIDLFWARRDPTEGTPENQNRDEFDSRVAFADAKFKEPRRRGAMSERGRFYIILGPATSMGFELRKDSGQAAGAAPSTSGEVSGADPTGGRAMGARDVWTWEHDDAQKFGLPKVEIVFVEDPITRAVRRDTQRNDALAAMPVAIKNVIVSPDMVEVPKWAPRGGLDPRIEVLVLSPAQAVEEMPATTLADSTLPKADSTLPKGDPGASRFTLVKDVFAIATETKTDPFSKITHVTSFTRQEELGWVAQYCSDSAEPPTLKVSIKITGEVKGETVNMNAPAEEMTPDRIKAMSGCWLLRGAIPVADMDPATYTFHVTIEDTVSGKSYNLTQEFKVE